MTRDQFSQALAMAIDPSIELIDKYDIDILDGFALSTFKRIATTIEVVATCIRWQCCTMNGGIDSVALNECREHFRHKVEVV